VELFKEPLRHQEAFVSHATHANAALTPRVRLRLAQLIVDAGWPIARASERYDVSWRTAKNWAERYAADGSAAMADRSSAPHHHPNKTSAGMVRKIVHLRWKHRLGPIQIGAAGHAGLDGARRLGPVPVEPADPHRPRHRGTDPALPSRRDSAR
jgi:hypothetical protein